MKNLLYLLIMFSAQFAFAQSELPEGFGDYQTIQNPEAGAVYYQMYVPPVFEITVWKDSVLRVEENQHLLENLTLGIEYKINTEIVKTSPKITTWTFKMPTIDTIIEQQEIIFYGNCEWVETVNPNWKNGDTIVEKVSVKLKTMKLVPIQNHLGRCSGFSNRNFFVAWLVLDNYEQYIEKRKIVHKTKKAIWLETLVDTVHYEIITYQPNYYKAIKSTRNVEFDTIQSIKFLYEVKLKNPVYSTIHQRKIIASDGFSSNWTDYLCPISHTRKYNFLNLQKALKTKGYDVDINNRFDSKTKWNLVQFQKTNELKVGSLGQDTFDALNIKFWW